MSQANDFPALFTEENLREALRPMSAALALWAARHRPLSPEEIMVPQCKFGEFCWLATYSQPDLSARPALQGGDFYGINDFAKTARGDVGGRMRARGGERHDGATSLVGRSDAAYGDQPPGSKCS